MIKIFPNPFVTPNFSLILYLENWKLKKNNFIHIFSTKQLKDFVLHKWPKINKNIQNSRCYILIIYEWAWIFDPLLNKICSLIYCHWKCVMPIIELVCNQTERNSLLAVLYIMRSLTFIYILNSTYVYTVYSVI